MEAVAGTSFPVALPVPTYAGPLNLAGPIYVVIYNPVTNMVWSTSGEGEWALRSAAVLPTALLDPSGEQWYYQFPSSMTEELSDMTQLFVVFQDSTTPASVQAMSDPFVVTVRTSVSAVYGPGEPPCIDGERPVV